MIRRFDLLLALATKDIRSRYYSLKLGTTYAFGVSLLTMIVLSAAFGRAFKDRVEGSYPLFVFCALIPWNFFSTSINHSTDCFRTNAPLVRKVPFPRELVPLGVVTGNAIHMLISFAAFAPLLFVFWARPSWTWLALPVALAALYILAAGLAMIAAIAGAFFLDVKPIVEVLVMLWFYSTPVFYPPSIVPEQFRWIVKWNPMAHMVELIRGLVLLGRWPSPESAALCLLAAILAFAAGSLLVRTYRGIIADRVG